MLGLLIMYMFLVPLYVSYDSNIDHDHLQTLLFFDIMFMLAKFLDLFIGFRNKEGELEPRLSMVIMKNLNQDFFLEIIYTFGPFSFNIDNLDSLVYFFFKFPRFGYLFNLSNVVNQTLDYYCKSWTEFEIKNKIRQFNILQFVIQTSNCFHLLACLQIMLATHRDFNSSWLYRAGIH